MAMNVIKMRNMIVPANWIAVLGVFLLSASVVSAGDAVLKDQKGKISYGIGVGVARDFKLRGVELDMDAFLKGLKDELSGSKLLMTEKELDATMDGYARELRLKQEQSEKRAGEENKKTGDAFLAENAKKKGVVTLPSGLQYKVLKAGNGDKPTEADAVKINYRGTLINGTEVDSSSRKTEPTVFKVAGAIPGLREAFLLMSPGSKWQIFIPSELAYGERRVYQIGPNSALIFEVELLSVAKSVDSKATPDRKASPGMRSESQPSGQKPSADISPGTGSAK
jgi:FKBP-type peptidyl-prolyl cis-trans isomerase